MGRVEKELITWKYAYIHHSLFVTNLTYLLLPPPPSLPQYPYLTLSVPHQTLSP